ncbi:MAG: cardiolipin synthase [Planctomycetota bacterium]
MPTLQFIFGFIIILGYASAIALIPRVVLARRESAATLSWLMFLLFVPVLGPIAYWLFGERRLKRFVRKRRFLGQTLLQSRGVERGRASFEPNPGLDARDRDTIIITTKLADVPPSAGNEIKVFIDANEASEAMLRAIDDAKNHIHFVVYIFRPDESGVVFRDHLVAAAKRGVKVKLLIDGAGSLLTKRSFFQSLTAAGGELAVFLPVNIFRGLYHANLRNHRKILIIDGATAFTGGLNVGDEYGSSGIRKKRQRKFGPWRDSHLQLRGPAVAALQDVFAEDWYFTTEREIDAASAYPELLTAGDSFVHVLPSGPDLDWEVIHHAIFTIITKATDHIFLTTPYFVPDRSMLVALATAALRGVDVRLLLPGQSDLALVQAAGRYHYSELLRAGVRIYEYQKGILHAKTVAVDNRWATIGSANLDLRSFRINFELNVVVYGSACATGLHETFIKDLDDSVEITKEEVAHWTFGEKLKNASARLVEGVL